MTSTAKIQPSTCWRSGLRRSLVAKSAVCADGNDGKPDRDSTADRAGAGSDLRIALAHSRLGDGDDGSVFRLPGARGATERGTLKWKDIEPVIYKRGSFRAATGLIEIENTANLTGGRCTPLAVMEEIWANAKDRKLPVHLDGARIFNASTALGVDVKTLTRGFDTIMFCLSKGLCAPVGSMLVGSAELMEQARIYRKALGGGMRQVGVLAAAGLIALEKMPARLMKIMPMRACLRRHFRTWIVSNRSRSGGDEHRDFQTHWRHERGGSGGAALRPAVY